MGGGQEASTIDTVPSELPRLYRSPQQGLVAGVAAGIAAHLGVSATAVRTAFVLLLGVNGIGVLLYAVFWAVLPVMPDESGQRPNRMQIVPFAAFAVGVLVLRAMIGGDQLTAALGWLIAVIAVGAGMIWHQSGSDERRRTFEVSAPWLSTLLTERGRRAYMLRFIGGGALVAVGVIGLAVVYSPVGSSLWAVVYGLVFAVLALAGVSLVAAPVLWRIFGALRAEREARIREQERAEFAAMVHDQVLHTLALIQRNATDSKTVHRLARAQERTLRNWLYRPTGSPAEKLVAALEQAAAEVEDAYGITVEVVAVGDTDTDERVVALVAAAREALVNAARHADVPAVSLYAEVEPEQLSVFVRDRGVGFDPESVQDGRHGVRGSIIGRMERHGGRAEIISRPGEGTEVRLFLPRRAKATTPDRKDESDD